MLFDGQIIIPIYLSGVVQLLELANRYLEIEIFVNIGKFLQSDLSNHSYVKITPEVVVDLLPIMVSADDSGVVVTITTANLYDSVGLQLSLVQIIQNDQILHESELVMFLYHLLIALFIGNHFRVM